MIPSISLQLETRVVRVRARHRRLYGDKWVDLEASKRMEKIKNILKKI